MKIYRYTHRYYIYIHLHQLQCCAGFTGGNFRWRTAAVPIIVNAML